MKNIVHIDGDIIVYSVGFAANDDPVHYALHSVKQLVTSIIQNTEADEYVMHLTGKGNFRDELASIQGYKENRKDSPKPTHYVKIREYLKNNWDAQVSEGCEADDTMGILASTPSEDRHIIASLDKDMDMISGWHYNWRKDELWEISQEEADRAFVLQLLTGDATDNIPGLKRVTGKIATKKIKEWCTEPDTFHEQVDRVKETYMEHAEDIDVVETLHEIGNLLWIRRYGYETWETYYEESCKAAEGASD